MRLSRLLPVLVLLNAALSSTAQPKAAADKTPKADATAGTADETPIEPDSTTEGSVTVGGQVIAYRAVAGTLTVGSTDQQDATLGLDGQVLPSAEVKVPEKPEDRPATARMFYTAYFKKGAAEHRPITFLYNGGPGSATMWLHMGSFGPRRVVVPDGEHQEGAPYSIVNNDYSLLDVSDLVFIDAPGTGFSRIFGKDKEKAFWGTDPDAHAFDRFIRRFLTKYDRWNSPKFLLGESYGTTRSAVLSNVLQNVDLNGIDLNGIILLSQILNFSDSPDGPRVNPGVDLPYELALPTYVATAFYHHKLPTQPADLQAFLAEVEQWSLGEYASALLQGSNLAADRRQAIAAKLHDYTGLSIQYLLKADLRITGGGFEKNLLDSSDETTGRLDTRFQGPSLNPLSEDADYDPQSQAIQSAYTTAINQYMRTVLKFGQQQTYLPSAYSNPDFKWDLRHQVPGGPPAAQTTSVNVMPDLADTMKQNPRMKVMLAGGYFDLATPFYAATYEMSHLPIPQKLQPNISYHFYRSGHMVYVNPQVLQQFHADVAAFITANQSGK
ncbi:MAG: S10 family peptidase [Acidobacteriaceae bacterium]